MKVAAMMMRARIGADDELPVEITARLESFRRRAEKSGRARFRGDDRGEHGPPRNRTRAERKILQVLVSPPGLQPQRHDAEEVKKQNSGIDGESRIHEAGI